jgi:hypothetical protein
MTDLYMHHSHVAALGEDDLRLRALDLQAMFQDARAEQTRIRDVIVATRNHGTFDYVTARRQASERLAEAALTGIELPDEAIPHAPSDTNLKLTLEGLNGRLATLEKKLSQIKSEHRVCIINLAKRHSATAGVEYLAAREQFVRSCASMQAIDQAMQREGLPSTEGIFVQSQCELPILTSERKAGESGWTVRLNYLMEPHLRAMPQNYRDQIAQLGLVMRLEG